jgi:hypothetical protein
MTDFMIIPMVFVISLVTCAILAVIVYRVDKNTDRRDSRN